MYHRSLSVLLVSFLLTAVLTSGCERKSAQPGAARENPVVPVAHPVSRTVTDYVDFTGRTDAKEVVDIRARVTGYLVKLPFREGAEVKAGDLLFEIDPRPYQAQLAQAQSQVALNEASLKLAQTTYARDRQIAATVAGGVSQQQLDQDRAAVDEALARVKASQEATKVYELNLEFTKVTSPINGQVSRYYMTRGNLVNIDQTLLTTIVSLNPMFVYFDMDEPTLLQIRKAWSGLVNVLGLPEDGAMHVQMGLQGEEGYPHDGTIDFFNNQVNSNTGSITVRGVFKNPRLVGDLPVLAAATVGFMVSPLGQGPLLALPRTRAGVRLLSPGMFVRIHLPIGQPHQALLVIDRAIQSDQGLKFVYVIDADNKVQYRRITTGALQKDGLRVVEGQGLKPNDWVVVGAIQQVKPGVPITPEQRKMPTLDATTLDTSTPSASQAKQGANQR